MIEISDEVLESITRIANHPKLKNPNLTFDPDIHKYAVKKVIQALYLYGEAYDKLEKVNGN